MNPHGFVVKQGGLLNQVTLWSNNNNPPPTFQEIIAQNVPIICLASPNVLVAAKNRVANFQPAILDSYTLWNVEQLYLQ